MKLIAILTIILILLSGLSACADNADTIGGKETIVPKSAAPGEKTGLTAENYPIIDGSTLLTPFSEAVTAAVLDLPLEEARLYVTHNRTNEAYKNLINKKADIIFVTPPSQHYFLDEEKIDEEQLEMIPLIKDGFVFFVNSSNPVNGMSVSSIVDIYSGKITNWKQLGGIDAEIKAFQRSSYSGSQTAMEQMVMKDKWLMKPPERGIYDSMGGIVSAVASFDNGKNAIGYSFYYYTLNIWNEDEIKYLKIDGVAPDNKSIADGSYPFVETIYMVLRKDEPEDSPARRLANWILSDEGKSIIEEVGYVPA